MTQKTEAAEAAANEVDDGPRTVTFGTGEKAVTLDIPRKWKRFKFMRRVNAGDIIGALEVVFGEECVEQLDDLDVTEQEFTDAIETVAKALGGVTVGNS